ncbi:MAG: TIGR03960 family B12-binding radical SAM protein [Coriobacteriales bacterium]|jgi:radical SAM family uncharacterized protein|nr:TIGR03960 family B12-binding radical SAM protein [Coriobacteriales bacterium]
MPHATLWDKVEPLLAHVERPSRYIDHEYHATTPVDASYRAVLLYPDTYEIGQANQGLGILYAVIRALDGAHVERAYLPWVDMAALMRTHGVPLFSLEGCAPVAGFDLVGITLPHELACTNILEALDLAGIPLHAAERGGTDPLVLGGGPCAYNPEPYAPFFDAIAIGEGEEVIVEVIEAHRRLRDAGAPRSEILLALAAIEGVYVPSLYTVVDGAAAPAAPGIPAVVRKRVITDFDASPVVLDPVVPFAEVTHDRFTVEILRGCTRGCRFCQAGMIYRPVRERSANTVVNAVARGLACTGYDEVSLTSLSSTDHSQIEEILRRINHALSGTGTGVSIPSQRLDAFGVDMAYLVAGEKKAGLTFAPEAGTQRLRDIINKNVTEADLIAALQHAYAAGWRRCKLYFMIGLPGETDDDIAGIAHLANLAYNTAKDAVPSEQRGNVRMSISVAVFVPKAATPFQWQGQIPREEAQRRIALLRATRLHKGIDLRWHDPATSLVEAAISRGGREVAPLIEEAWRLGAAFDAWSEKFELGRWQQAAQNLGLSVEGLAQRAYGFDGPLPWDHISCGVGKAFLRAEYGRAQEGLVTPDCSFTGCTACGVCQDLDVAVVLGGPSRG